MDNVRYLYMNEVDCRSNLSSLISDLASHYIQFL